MMLLKNRNILVLFIVVLFLAFIVRLIFFVGLSVGDEFAYAQHAYNLSIGEFSVDNGDWYSFRCAIFGPVSLFFDLFGVTDHTAVIWPLLCSLLSVLLIFAFARALFDIEAAFLASLVLAIFPLDAMYATHLMPDTIMPLFLGLSIYLFLKGDRSHINKNSYLYFIFSGIALGIGYLTRDIAVIFFLLFFIAYIFYKRGVRPKYFIIFLVFFLIVLIECIFYYVIKDDFFLRWHTVYGFYSNQKLPNNFLYYPKAMFFPMGYFGIFYYFAAGSLVYSFFTKKIKDIAIILFWFFSIFLYLEFGTMNLDRFLPIFKEVRFLSVLTMPAVLLIAHFLKSIPSEKMLGSGNNKRIFNNIIFGIFIAASVAILSACVFNEKIPYVIKNASSAANLESFFDKHYILFTSVFKKIVIILPLLFILGSIVSYLLINKIKAFSIRLRFALAIFFLVLAPSSVFSLIVYSAQYRNSVEKYREVSSFIRQNPSINSIYCMHWRWPIILSYYLKYEKGSHYLHGRFFDYSSDNGKDTFFKYAHNIKDPDDIKGSYAVVDKEFLYDTLQGQSPPYFIYNIPKNWKPERIFKDVVIYYVE
ncbi:MAG: glycosyltransferase family 39 protein [Candidatus Omnitrophota bacterium]